MLITEKGNRLCPVKIRYIWPSELDLMAKLAGLTFKDRWGSWEKSTFTPESNKHITVYVNS